MWCDITTDCQYAVVWSTDWCGLYSACNMSDLIPKADFAGVIYQRNGTDCGGDGGNDDYYHASGEYGYEYYDDYDNGNK